MKILIVDDEIDILEILESTFSMFGFDAKTAKSGNEALEVLKSFPADTVISDIRMPDGNGIELLQALKKENVNQPKVIFLSGFTDQPPEELFEMGVDGFFKKPFNASEIRATLEKSQGNLESRWQDKQVHIETKGHVEIAISSLENGKKDNQFKLGRGGFFARFDQPEKIDIEDYVDFKISVEDGAPCPQIEGVGRVKWIRHEASSDGPQGLGVEIFHLKKNCLSDFCNFMESFETLAYIPYK